MLSSNIQFSASDILGNKWHNNAVFRSSNLRKLIFKSSVFKIPQILTIFSLQKNTRGAPRKIVNLRLHAFGWPRATWYSVWFQVSKKKIREKVKQLISEDADYGITNWFADLRNTLSQWTTQHRAMKMWQIELLSRTIYCL